MTLSRIDLDDEALAEAMRLMGSVSKQATVNAVLWDYVARGRRLEAAAKLAFRGQHGEFDAAARAHADVKRARRAVYDRS